MLNPVPARSLRILRTKRHESFLQGRQEARIEAKTKPFTPPIPEQRRYGW